MSIFRAPTFLILLVTIIGSLGNLIISGAMSFILEPNIFRDYFLIVASAQIIANIVHFGGSNYYGYLFAQNPTTKARNQFLSTHSFLVIPVMGIFASFFLCQRHPNISLAAAVPLLVSYALQGLVRTKLLLEEEYRKAITLGVLHIASIVISVLVYRLFSNSLAFLFALQGLLNGLISYLFIGVTPETKSLKATFDGKVFKHMFFSMLNSFFVSMCMTGDRLLAETLRMSESITYSYAALVFGYLLVISSYAAGLWTNLLTHSFRHFGVLHNPKSAKFEKWALLLALVPMVFVYPGKFFLKSAYDVDIGLAEATGFAIIVGLNILMKYYLALLNILGAPRVFSVVSTVVLLIVVLVQEVLGNKSMTILELLSLTASAVLIVLLSLRIYTSWKINVLQGV